MLPLSIKIYKYVLKAKKPLNFSDMSLKDQEGCIIACEWEPGLLGYADICPKSFFKDLPLDEQIKSLLTDRPTSLVKNSLTLSMLDAQARKSNTDLLAGGFLIRNHKLINSIDDINQKKLEVLKKDGFLSIKVKAGVDDANKAESFNSLLEDSPVLWRIDFNNTLNKDLAESFLSKLSEKAVSKIDFIEDIFPYSPEAWSQVKEKYNVKLGLDNIQSAVNFGALVADVLVLKPGRVNIVEVLKKVKNKDIKYVVTHSMDHPLGMSAAVGMAIKLQFFVKDRMLDCGLLPSDNFEWDSAFEEIEVKGPHIVPKDDVGFGYSESFNQLEWSVQGDGSGASHSSGEPSSIH